MYNVYTRLAVPDVPKDVLEPGLVCAASWNQQWYRVQVSKDGTVIVLGETQIWNFIFRIFMEILKLMLLYLQVVNYDPSGDSCNVRFLDYGGYYTFSSSDLKQIRTDFLALPFQVR